jgi:hypothetical protein
MDGITFHGLAGGYLGRFRDKLTNHFIVHYLVSL